MKLNQQVEIIVAEPWDFTSIEGDNKFSATVCECISSRFGEAYLIKNKFPFILLMNYTYHQLIKKIIQKVKCNLLIYVGCFFWCEFSVSLY